MVPPPGAFLMSLSLLSGWCSSERPGAVKGAPMLGAAKRNLDSEDRSGTMGQEGKASERPVKDGSAKMAPSRAALNTFAECELVRSHELTKSINAVYRSNNQRSRSAAMAFS